MSSTSCPAASSDKAAGSDDLGEWLSAAEIARRRGLDRSTTSRRISRFVEQKLLEVRDDPSGARRYNLEAFDKASAANIDPARSLAAGQRQPKPAAAPAIAEDDDLDNSVVLFGDFANSACEFVRAAMCAVDILQARADEIAASVSTTHAHEVIRRIHTDMHAAIKDASDSAKVPAYHLTAKGRGDFGLDRG